MTPNIKSLLSACLIFATGLASCGNDDTDQFDNHHRTFGEYPGKVYRVALSLAGDCVDDRDEPLSKAVVAKSYVGINVVRVKKGESSPKAEKYAYGLFIDQPEIEINLAAGYLYSFEVTSLTDRTDALAQEKKQTWLAPFFTGQYDTGLNGFDKATGDFQYTYAYYSDPAAQKPVYFTRLSWGDAYVNAPDPAEGVFPPTSFAYPRVKRFYGKFDKFDPTLSNEVHVPMAYKCFGLRIEVADIPSGTFLTVEDGTESNLVSKKEPTDYLQFPKSLVLYPKDEGVSQFEDIYSLHDLESDTDQFRLIFTWHKPDGLNERFAKTIDVSAKTRKILKVNITGDAYTMTKGNIILDYEDEDMADDPNDVNYNSK